LLLHTTTTTTSEIGNPAGVVPNLQVSGDRAVNPIHRQTRATRTPECVIDTSDLPTRKSNTPGSTATARRAD
jgi:hypothetical protein